MPRIAKIIDQNGMTHAAIRDRPSSVFELESAPTKNSQLTEAVMARRKKILLVDGQADPGAKPMPPGMTPDTLALAKRESPGKPVLTVLLAQDNIWSGIFDLLTRDSLGEKYDLRFIYFTRASELARLAETHAFDLVFFYLGNITWDVGYGNLCALFSLAENERMIPDGTIVDFLGNLKARHGKLIIVTQGLELTERFKRVGVTFLTSPFSTEQFRRALQPYV